MDNPENRRDELCERFRQSLSKPVTEQFFDEDELVEIFDYAGDINDEYLQFEVLLCGTRLYPDSLPLRERRAIFYCSFSDDLAEKYLDDNVNEHTVLFDIMRLRQASPKDEEAEKALQGLLDDHPCFTDEEIIQYVDLASSLNSHEWLFSHIDEIRLKVDFLPSFLYEVAIVAETILRFDISIKMLEELTEIEPYNISYWTMLANDLQQTGNIEGALSAIDYALAIDPDDIEALKLYARILYEDETDRPKAYSILKDLVTRHPTDIQAVRLCYMLSFDIGSGNEGRELAERTFREHPDSYELLNDTLFISPENAEELLDLFYMNGGTDVSMWIGMAQQYYHSDKIDLAIAVCESFSRNFGCKFPNLQLYISCLFKKGRFEECLDIFIKNDANDELFNQKGQYWNCVIYLISLLKTHNTQMARMFAEHLIDKWDIATVPLPQRLEAIAMRDIVIEVLNKFIHFARPQWKRFDPLSLWGQ